MKKPELLIPAGSLEVLKIAITYGADAVYVGGELYGLRAKAKNFSDEDLEQAIAMVHDAGKKIYITANITAHNRDLAGISEYFRKLNALRPDALIISDPGVFALAKKYCPDVELHISTQANNVNFMTYQFWWEQGAKRVVSGRELSLEELRGIRDNIPPEMEIETFIHGAMCISYSGRCLLSAYMTGRDANLGACTHPCRWKYRLFDKAPLDVTEEHEIGPFYLEEENRPGEYFPVMENERGTYIFNSKDLCMIDHIPELIISGIDSFKIEGRMKTALYVAVVARTYRKAIDDFFEDPELYEKNREWYHEEISKCTYRSYTTGFFFHPTDGDSQVYEDNFYIKEYIYLGYLTDCNGTYGHFEQRNKFSVGDEIEIMCPNGENHVAHVVSMKDEDGNEITSCPHPKKMITAEFDVAVEDYQIMRMKGKTV